MTKYLTAPPAHAALFNWGNAGAKSGTYSLKAIYGFENYVLVTVKQLEKARNYYVSISDRGNARFSKTAAEDCAKWVKKRIRQNAYSSMVPALSRKWAGRKSSLKLAHQVGMATEQLVDNITAFRSNLSGFGFKETKHTGFIVGINEKADYAKDPEKMTKLTKKHINNANKIRKVKRGKSKYNRFGSDFLNAKLYWLEHGKIGTGFNGAKYRQPPRPIYTKAVQDFIAKFKGAEDFIGQLKMNSKGHLEFKFKAHR